MSITITEEGVLSNTYATVADETHFLRAPGGVVWNVTANGTDGSFTAVDSGGTPETWSLVDPSGVTWEVAIDDAGLISVKSFDKIICLAPVVNAPVVFNGVPATGYELWAYQAGTQIPATIFSNSSIVSMLSQPVVLNAYGFPTTPIFIQVGIVYDFYLFETSGGTPVKTWPGVVGGVPVKIPSATEWSGGSFFSTYVNSTQLSASGDFREMALTGRRMKLFYDVAGNALYGTIADSTYDGERTLVTIVPDSTVIPNSSFLFAAVAVLNPSSSAVPGRRNIGTSTILQGDMNVAILSGLNLIPPGLIVRRNSLPPGWLQCNGAAVSRTTFAALFSAISTTFGVGDGSTTFNLPTIAAAGSQNYYIWAQG